MNNYIVVEYQTTEAGKTATLVNAYADMAQAESKYHSILSAAAVSNIPLHGAILFTETGFLMQKVYDHREGK